MSDEEKRNVEILNNIKEYMQNSIDSGHHKFIYNDLDWDEKCIDIINAIDYFIEKVEQQQNEIEEKSTIIMAGSEKVKQLEKEIEDLKTITNTYDSFYANTGNRIVLADKEYFDSGIFIKKYISKDKIREIRDKAEVMDYYSLNDVIDDLSKLIGDYEEDE